MDVEDTAYPGIRMRSRDFSVEAPTAGGKPDLLDTPSIRGVVL